MLKVFLFLIYYLRKCLSIFFGLHHTSNPISLGWRWNHWKAGYERQKHKKRMMLISRRKTV